MKKQKIVITGGLGYIGTELCKLYSGTTRFKDIIVIDNRFVSERVKQLRDWDFNFVQANILDKTEILSNIFKDSDIVFHLAGITDVAYTKTEEHSGKDKQIEHVAIDGTLNILSLIPETCKFIFPSTHVVFEGLEKTVFNVTEDITPCPVLTYARSKVQNELDIQRLSKNYIIFRLGSVYGYSTDTMRINIMPNLFSKMASQGQPIKLFSGGVQYKSLVSVWDVVRCFTHLADSPISNTIFHLVNENVTVRQVAEICKKYKPDVEIISTTDEIPNLGYTLSNDKLVKETGFKFFYNIDIAIKEMIENWSFKRVNSNIEYIIRGEKEYIDERGKISNFELPEPINLIGYISSKKHTIRANHYHPIQEQKCLLVKGKYISFTKDLGLSNSFIEERIINVGDISVIKPNVAHAMLFLEDSIFINLVRGDREHENYGITHTIPYKLIDDTLLKKFK